MKPGIYPAIILAGGLGTRLRALIDHLPKPMASVNGKPFLHYVFHYLEKQGIKEAILSVGYRRETIEDVLGTSYLGIKIRYSTEDEPLGTGGGIKKAFQLADDYAFILNGDTFFDVDLARLSEFYFHSYSDIALSLKKLRNFDRYGTVLLDSNNRITEFAEKKFVSEGLINGGVYFASKRLFHKIETGAKFSFEKDVLEEYTRQLKLGGKVFDGYFIDIGIPDDYRRAQEDFAKM